MIIDNKLPSVSMLRGIACLGVCIMHFSGTIDSEKLNSITKYGGYGVPIFFAISGYILPYSMEKSGYKIRYFFKFILKRLVSLEPAYFFSILGIFLLSFVAQYSKFNISDQIEIFTSNNLLHLFYLVDVFDGKWLNPVYWTLAIEFQFYLFIGLIFPLLRSKNIYILKLIFIILNLITLLISKDHYVPNYFTMFLPGIILFWYTSKRTSLKTFPLLNLSN